MKKAVIWILGLLLSFASGILMWKSYQVGVDELSKTVDNVSIAFIGGMIICSIGIGFCLILHLIILFYAFKYLRGVELSIHDFLIKKDNTTGIKILKVIGYLFTILYLSDVLMVSLHYHGLESVYEIVSVLSAATVTALFLIWLSAISRYRSKDNDVQPVFVILNILILVVGPFILFPIIGNVLKFVTDK